MDTSETLLESIKSSYYDFEFWVVSQKWAQELGLERSTVRWFCIGFGIVVGISVIIKTIKGCGRLSCRSRADNIIVSKRDVSAAEINRIIDEFQSLKEDNLSEADKVRISKLRKMRDLLLQA